MSVIGNAISLRGIANAPTDFLPFNLAAGITKADEGKPVALDTSAANTVKIAGDGEQVIGRLTTVEIRTVEGIAVGTVERHGGFKFAISGTVNIGDTVVGDGAGGVKAAATPNHADNMVVEVGADYAIVLR